MPGLDSPKPYLVRSRYFVSGEGWKVVDLEVTGTFRTAGEAASRVARELDAKYGDDHFWSVDLFDNPIGEYGSYCQLFHGRTS